MAGAGIPTTGPVTPEEIYQLLLQQGLSTPQAIGVMANMYAESRLNPESGGTDSNGYFAGGLISWNAASYPNVHQLITGNPQSDVRSQISYLLTSTNGLAAGLQGATAADVAGNFAANVEVCDGCTPGSTIPNGWTQRVANASLIQSWVSSGKWPTSVGSSGTPATGGGAGSSASGCLVSLPSLGPIGGGCLISNAQGRAVVGALMMTAALPVGLIGFVILAALAFRGTGAGRHIAGAAETAGNAVAFIPGLDGAGAAVAAAGSAEVRARRQKAADRQRREQAAQERHTERQYARQPRARANRERDEERQRDPVPF
jgi:hypothetical protein